MFWEDACQLSVGRALGRKVEEGLGSLEADDEGLSPDSDICKVEERCETC